MRRIIAFIPLLLFFTNGISQSFNRYSFNRISRANGLISDDVTTVAQDKNGFMWIGGYNGLQRYDGKRFVTFRHNPKDSFSLPAEGISHLLYDTKNRLWVLTAGNKIGIFDIPTSRFIPATIVVPEKFRTSQILRFKEDKDGKLLILIHQYGIATYNEQLNTFSTDHNAVKLPQGTFALDISKDYSSDRYFVSTNKGYEIYRGGTGTVKSPGENTYLSEINAIIKRENASGPMDIFKDTKGRIWSNIWSGKKGVPEIFNYDSASGKWSYYSESITTAANGYHEVIGFLEQKNGVIWIFGHNVFARLNRDKNIFEDVRNEGLSSLSIPFENIYKLFEDKQGNIWVCSNNGLYLFNPEKQFITTFTNRRLDGIEQHYAVDVILETHSGKIYTTIWGLGIFAYDNEFRPLKNPIIPDKKNIAESIWDMYERKNGHIWMGVQGGRIYVFDQKKESLVQLKPSILEGKTVRQVTEDSAGNMWLGTQTGILIKCVNANYEDTVHSYKPVIRVNAHITKLYTDSSGMIWVVTDRDGLYLIDPLNEKVEAHYTDRSPADIKLPSVGVTDILQYNDSIFLIASGGINVLNLKEGTMKRINTNDGLPSNDITAIAKDGKGDIWLGSHSGIYRMQLGSKIYLTFGAEDGIIFGRRKITTVTPFRDGRLIFGSTNDLLIVSPASMQLPPFAHPVFLSGFRVFDKIIPVETIANTGGIVLPHNENSITFDLTTYSYSNAPAVMYMLEGVDKDWKNAVNYQVNYNYLAPGDYLFKAKSIVATGKESEKILEIKIDIEPPFWKTWWFYGLLILAAVSILYLLDMERMNKLRSNQQLRTDIALNLHEEVSTALNNINLLSEMALRKADVDTARSKELIAQIREKSNDMIIGMDDMLWSIDPENDTMEQTLLRMNEFIDALKNRHDATIVMKIDEEAKKLRPDMKVRHGFFTIFKESLRMICQNSGGKNTLINLDLEKNKLVISLQDNVTVNESDLAVVKNMENMKMHAAQINADLDILLRKEATKIILIVPVK